MRDTYRERRRGGKKEWTKWAVPLPDHGTMPMLRAGVFYGSPSRFTFLAKPLQRSTQRSTVPMVETQLSCKTMYFPIEILSWLQVYITTTSKLNFPCVSYFSASRFYQWKNNILIWSWKGTVHQRRYRWQRPYPNVYCLRYSRFIFVAICV